MRFHHVLFRGGVLAMLASLTLACNAILGVDDVSLSTPDAAPVVCRVNSNFGLVASNPTTSSLIHFKDGTLTVPSLGILLNVEDDPDGLILRLYDNMGQHGVLNAPGTYQFTPADAKLETCGICAFLRIDTNSAGNSLQTFWALGQGDLNLTKADSTGLKGSMHNLKFRHVDTSGSATIDINDGCSTTVDDVEFDMPYSP